MKIRNLFLILFLIAAFKATAQNAAKDDLFNSPEGVIYELYDQLTFPKGETPDWDLVRTLFSPQATFILRTGKTETKSFSLDGWILDFVNFIHNMEVESTGFEEKIIKMKSTLFGDIAQVWVLYTAYLPGRTPVPQEGIDSFHLVKKDGKWKIISVLNELPGPNRPVPEFLKK